MREPPRLRENGQDPLAASLLDAAHAFRRPPSTRGRILKSLGLPLALSVGAPVSAAAASGLAAKALIVASVVTVVAGGGVVVYRLHAGSEGHRARTAAAPRAVAMPAPAPPVVPAPASAVDPDPALTAAPVPAAPATARPSTPAAGSRQRTRRSMADVSDAPQPALPAPAAAQALPAPLAREIALLDAAERAERRHDHGAALAALDEHARAFPDGALRAEAQVLRISALLAQGDQAAAREQGRLFLSRFAPSPLAARVRSMLSEPTSPTKELP
jgi:hypothetical protein